MPTYNISDPTTGQKVSLTGDSPPTEQEIVDIFSKVGKGNQPAPAPPKGGLVNDVVQSVGKRASNIASEMTPQGDESLGQSIIKSPERALRTAGQAAGAVGDVVGAGAKSLYKNLTPQSVQEEIGNKFKTFAQTDTGKWWLNAIQTGMAKYEQLKAQYPETAKDLEAAVNIGTLLPIGKGGQIAGGAAKEGINIARDVAAVAGKKSAAEIEKGMAATVTKGMEKGVRPGIAGMRTEGMAKAYFRNATDAVEKIVSNKGELILTDEAGEKIVGKLPESLKQFRDAISQTKSKIFSEYNEMAVQAGKQERMVNLKPITAELKAVTESKVLNDLAPDVVEYANKRMAGLAKRGTYSTTEAQEGISILNGSLDAFYKNPSYETATKAYVDSLVVNNLRKSLDGVIENAVGKGYQDLKNSYGALKSIEKDVSRRAKRRWLQKDTS